MGEKVTRQGAREALALRVLVGCGLAGGVTGALWGALSAMEIAVPRPLLVGAAVVAIPALAWAMWVHWRNIDEAAREAHKFAWFWGASGAMLLAMPIAALITTRRLELVFGPHEPSEWVAGGLIGMAALQVAGYGLTWAGWWLVRQR